MTIGEASAADEPEIVALWRACGLVRPWNDASRDCRRAIAHPASTILIARRGAVLAGTAMVGDDGHRGWVYYLAVAAEFRRSGLGRALMGAADAWLRDRGCAKIQLMVRDGNDEAIAFYRALALERQAVVVLGRFLEP